MVLDRSIDAIEIYINNYGKASTACLFSSFCKRCQRLSTRHQRCQQYRGHQHQHQHLRVSFKVLALHSLFFFLPYLFSISSSGRIINYTSKTSTINGVKMGEYTFENNTHTVTTFENGTGTFTNINTKADTIDQLNISDQFSSKG